MHAKRPVGNVSYSPDKFTQTHVIHGRSDDLLELRPILMGTVAQEDKAEQESQIVNLRTCADLYIQGEGPEQPFQGLLASEGAGGLPGHSGAAIDVTGRSFGRGTF